MKVANLLAIALPLALMGCVATTDHLGYHPGADIVQYRPYEVYPQSFYRSPRMDDIDARQREQQNHIVAGIRSGELTQQEAEKLRTEQRAISREEAAYRRNGYLSTQERAELQRELNEAERHIRNEKNDRQDRH